MNFKKSALCLLILFAINVKAKDVDDGRDAYVKKDFATALKLLIPLIDNDNPEAAFLVGKMTLSGQGTAKDTKKGIELITTAAEANLPSAVSMLAFGYMAGTILKKDYKESFKWALKGTDQGDPTSKSILGLLYLNGLYIPSDPEKAAFLFKESANAGNPLGSYEYGKLLMLGIGVPRDETAGKAYLTKSTTTSQFNLPANLIIDNINNLIKWREGTVRIDCDTFTCAAKSGLSSGSIQADVANSNWIEVAAQVLAVKDTIDLNYFLLGKASEGIGDLDAAIIYYKLSILNDRKIRKCDGLFNNCSGVILPHDSEERISFLETKIHTRQAKLEQDKINAEKKKKADEIALANEQEKKKLQADTEKFNELLEEANAGSSDAEFKLSKMYLTGTGTPKDEEASLKWLTKAAQQGVADAQYELGEDFRIGHLVKIDLTTSELYLRKSAQQGNEAAKASLFDLDNAKNLIANVGKKSIYASNGEEDKSKNDDKYQSILNSYNNKRFWIHSNDKALMRVKFYETSDGVLGNYFTVTEDASFTVLGNEKGKYDHLIKVQFLDGKIGYLLANYNIGVFTNDYPLIPNLYDGKSSISDFDEYIFNQPPKEIFATIKARQIKVAAEMKAKGGVKIGMTKEQVLKSNWGKPNSVNRTINSNTTHEQWVYGTNNYLYFVNGILTTIQN